MTEPVPQAALFLVVTIDQAGESRVRDLLLELPGLRRAVGFRSPEGRLSCVTGIGSRAWDRLFAGPRPTGLHPFRALAGPVHRAVATAGDLLFHIRAQRPDLCFALASEIMDRIRDVVTVRDEVHGFEYFDVRDLLGFAPYTLALGADAHTAAAKTTDGAFVLSTRGGDFELHIGQDVAIGYLDHDADTVRLYFQETLTFFVHAGEAAVTLPPAA